MDSEKPGMAMQDNKTKGYAKQDFCSNILRAKQDAKQLQNFCSTILGTKQNFCSKYLGAKKDFCSTILDVNQDFCSTFVVQSKTFVQTFGVPSKKVYSFWPYLAGQAMTEGQHQRCLFKHLECKARKYTNSGGELIQTRYTNGLQKARHGAARQ